MLTLKLLREDPEYVIERLSVRNVDAASLVEQILEADASRRASQTQADALVARQKELASQIRPLMQQGKRDEAEKIKEATTEIKEQVRDLGTAHDLYEKQMQELL
ncbi:MAG: serine--tRNA ligase, partial [Bacteroidales bacterium]